MLLMEQGRLLLPVILGAMENQSKVEIHIHTSSKNTYTHTIPQHVYHHSSVGSTIHIPYMWIGKKCSPISPLDLIGENFITLLVIFLILYRGYDDLYHIGKNLF